MKMIIKQTFNFEVYPNDLPGEYTWDEAVDACKKMGDGWRLPTKEELYLMCINTPHYYWSSTELLPNSEWYYVFNHSYQYTMSKNTPIHTRPVRDVKQNEE
jgi:hypothetical protein